MRKIIKKRRAFLTNKSITSYIICFELIIILLSISAIGIIYYSVNKQVERQKEEYVVSLLNQKVETINNQFLGIEEKMIHMMYHSAVIGFLSETERLKLLKNKKAVDEYIVQMKVLEEYIDRIIIFNEEVIYNGDYSNNHLKELIEKQRKRSHSIYPRYLGSIVDDEGEYQLIFATNVYDSIRTLKKVGDIIFVIKGRLISEQLASDSARIVIVDETNHIVIAEDNTGIGEEIKRSDMDEVIWLEDCFNDKNMKLSLVARQIKVKTPNDVYRLWAIFALFGILLLITLVSSHIFITNNFAKHLQRINTFIKSISEGDFRNLKKRLKLKGAKEIIELSNEINLLLDEIGSLTKRLVQSTSLLYKAEISKKEAELSYLKSQINPHFLYNTLNVIKGIATINKQAEIEVMTMALVNIFRYSIKGEEFVPLAEELEIAKAYIQIQMIRFEDAFEVTYDIEEHLFEVEVLKMILQPILENAIQYGVESSYNKNHIIITARETEKHIELAIKDDGTGISPEKLELINQELEKDNLSEIVGEHLGLINVSSRIKHYYGDHSGIRVESCEGEWTLVTIYISSGYIN